MLLLIKPYFKTHLIAPVIGLGYIASYLKSKGYEVEILDALRLNMDINDVIQYANKIKPEAIGISVLSLYSKEAFILSRKLKENGHKIIIGGVHATFAPYETLIESNCDYVIAGEGEIAMYMLAKNNYTNNNIKGVYSLQNLKNFEETYEYADEIENLDELPFPDWKQIDPRLYPIAPQGVIVKKTPVGIIMSSRGCPYSCTFCSSCNLFKKKLRFRSAKNVIDEIEYLHNFFNVKEFQFIDDNLTLNKDFILSLCKEIKNRNLNICWSCPTGIRADKFDEEIASAMIDAGCYLITFGIESSDNELLNKIKKRENIEVISAAIKIAKKTGIMIVGNFILGLPGETEHSINKTINYAVNSDLDFAQFAILRLLPGSELYKTYMDNKDLTYSVSSFSQVDYIPDSLTENKLIELQGKAFRKFYFSKMRMFKAIKFIHFAQIKYLIFRLFEYHFFKFW